MSVYFYIISVKMKVYQYEIIKGYILVIYLNHKTKKYFFYINLYDFYKIQNKKLNVVKFINLDYL